MDAENARARGLLAYLGRLGEMRSRVETDLRRSVALLWLHELDGSPAELSPLEEGFAASSRWLKLPRPSVGPPPALPQELVGWTKATGPGGEPVLRRRREQLVDPDELLGRTRPVRVEEDPERPRLFEQHLSSWRAWRGERDAQAPHLELYRRLYTMRELSSSSPESHELVLGLGLLSWRGERGELHRHLLSTPCSIELEPGSGALVLRAEPDPLRLEEEFLSAGETPPALVRDRLEHALEALGEEISSVGLMAALTPWVNAVSADATL